MPATGFQLPAARTVEAGSGSWANDVNILDEGGTEATFTLTLKNTTGRWLAGQSFGFDSLIPAGATIDAVEIKTNYRVNNTGGIANPEIQAFVGGVAVGSVNALNPTEPTTLTPNTFDITADRAWTRADLLNGTFEVKVRGRNGNNATDPSYRFDYVEAQVTYTAEVAPDLVEDDFNRANSGTISDATHPWVERLDTGGAISNNTLRQLTSGGTPLVAVWDQALSSVDMWAEATVAGTYAGGFLGCILRYNPTTDNGFSVEMADGFLKIVRVVNGGPDTLADVGPAWTPAVGQLWRAEVEGAGASTVIRLYIDNVLRKTWTSPKTGLSGTFADTFLRPGLHLNSENNDTTQAWANFRAGKLPYTAPGGGEVAIEGAVDAVAELAGAVTRDSDVAGAVEAIADLAGDGSRERTAEATIDAVAELAGDASRDRAAAANIDAVGELVGDITVTAPGGGEVAIEGAVDAVAEIVGAVVRDQAAAATVDAVAELAGAVIRDRAVVGAVEAIGELVGDITIAGQVTITGAIEAVAEIVAAPIVAKAAAGAVEAVADLAGEVVLSQLVAAAIEAVAELVGDATVTGPITVTAEVDVVIGPTRLRAQATSGITRSRAQVDDIDATRLGAAVAATRSRAQAAETLATTRSRAAATLNGGTRNRAQVDDVEATRLGLEAQLTRV